MADESDLERTEPASPRRLEQAREEGQVARSAELGTFAVLMTAAAGLATMGGALFGKLADALAAGLTISREEAFDSAHMMVRLQAQAWDALVTLAPLLGLIFIAALGAPMLLNGWLFSPKALVPDFARLNPLKGLARIFSSHGLVELAKAIAKVLLVGTVSGAVIWHQKEAVLALATEGVPSALPHLGQLVSTALLAVVGGMAVIVLIDVPFQLWEHSRKLRMTRDELRREHKETEGDPHVKARIRSLQREAARKRMMAEVPKADVVVTNPTHYSVALCYGGDGAGAPRVVAKGTGFIAARIRELAAEHRVPVMEAPPLARALYHSVELGAEIPEALYNAVAEVLAYVYQLRHYRGYGGAVPVAPGALAVPAELDPGAPGR